MTTDLARTHYPDAIVARAVVLPPVIDLNSTNAGLTVLGDDPGDLIGDRAATGQAILSATGEVYYCRKGEEAVCLIDTVDLALPVTVVAGGATVAVIEYELPQ